MQLSATGPIKWSKGAAINFNSLSPPPFHCNSQSYTPMMDVDMDIDMFEAKNYVFIDTLCVNTGVGSMSPASDQPLCFMLNHSSLDLC